MLTLLIVLDEDIYDSNPLKSIIVIIKLKKKCYYLILIIGFVTNYYKKKIKKFIDKVWLQPSLRLLTTTLSKKINMTIVGDLFAIRAENVRKA